MINVDELGARIIIGFGDGKIFLSESTIWGFIIAVIIAAVGIWLGHGLKIVPETKRQIAAEFIVEKIYDYAKENLGRDAELFAPYIGTIFLYILMGSSLGIFGQRPITADVNVTFGLSLMTFLLIQVSGFRLLGAKGKLKHMCDPYPFMLPLNGGLHTSGIAGFPTFREHFRRGHCSGSLDEPHGLAQFLDLQCAFLKSGSCSAAQRLFRYV